MRSRLPEVSERLAAQVVGLVQRLRDEELLKPPGVAETLDWARALHRLGVDEAGPRDSGAHLGAVISTPRTPTGEASPRPVVAVWHAVDEAERRLTVLLDSPRALRSAGFPVTHDRASGFLEAVALVGADDPVRVSSPGRRRCARPRRPAALPPRVQGLVRARRQLPRSVPPEKPRRIRAPLRSVARARPEARTLPTCCRSPRARPRYCATGRGRATAGREGPGRRHARDPEAATALRDGYPSYAMAPG